MKLCQFLLLIFIFISSTFAKLPYGVPAPCKRGGSCTKYTYIPGKYVEQDPGKFELICYYYKCRFGEQRIVMEGSGTYDDFVNTCKYVEPKIKRASLFFKLKMVDSNYNFMYNDYDLILAVCDYDEQEECEKIMTDKQTYKKIHDQFNQHHYAPTAFNQETVETCTYNNTPLAQLPQVQCETGGVCQAGKNFYLYKIKDAEFVTKTCDACVMFVCTLDGKQIIEGSGCYEDFVKACKSANPSAVAKFKKDDLFSHNVIKANFYYDTSMIVASCSDADNCHKYAFDNYMTEKVFETFYVDKDAKEVCHYDKKIEEVSFNGPTKTTTSNPDATCGGNSAMKFFFGIYFVLALIY